MSDESRFALPMAVYARTLELNEIRAVLGLPADASHVAVVSILAQLVSPSAARALYDDMTASARKLEKALTALDNPCCGGTGYADYAAVPCSSPTCTARRVH